MAVQPGRNDLCPCGSGKKMKACHPGGFKPPAKNRNIMLIGIGVAVVAVVAVAMSQPTSKKPVPMSERRPSTPPANPYPATNNARPVQPTSTQAPGTPGSPQPGPAPPGKVWSVEHGHWHDDPAAAGAAKANSGIQLTPGQTQPLQVPSPQNANRPPGTLTPQPPGPAPEGKVWSPEHGHWHDAPKSATPAAPPQGTGPN